MIDSHCHLDLPPFAQDVDQVLADSRSAGVSRFLIPGTTPSGWQRQHQLANAHADIDIAYGLHPYFLSDDENLRRQHTQMLEQQLGKPHDALVAIGETGLDKVVDVALDIQQPLLMDHLALVKEMDLPVILHHRKSHHLLLKAIKDSGFSGGGVIHAFSGNAQIAQAYIDCGFVLGIGGTITYPRGSKTRNAVKAVGIEHVLLETDAPDMPMSGRQGKRNSPAYLGDVVSELAALVDVTEDEISRRTSDTYHRVFSRRR